MRTGQKKSFCLKQVKGCEPFMSNESSINVHDIIRRYSLPISRKNQSIKECLKSCYRDFYLDLKEVVARDYPDDFPSDFYNDLLNKYLSKINDECSMILNILKLDNQDHQLKKFDELMRLLVENNSFRADKFEKGSLMARIRPGMGPYDRKNIFHIPFTYRERSSSQRFSIPNNPCLYLSAYQGFKPHNYEMVKAAWIECGMPSVFTYCIYELQNDIYVLHFGKSGCDYLSEYDYAKDEDKKRERLEAIIQYLLSFPMRAACHISVENKSEQDRINCYEEYLFPQLLMQWLQKNSKFDGIGYQGASSNLAQRELYIGNLALPARNISAENEYDPYLKKCFKLSKPQVKDLSKDLNSDEMIKKIKAVEIYSEKLEQALNIQDVPPNHPYIELFSYCRSLHQIYSKMVDGNICTVYEEFVSIYETVQTIDTEIENCKTAEEWICQNDSRKLLTEVDFENILLPFHNIVIPAYKELNRIFYLQDCGSFLKEMNFQKI
ncbi:hypothetical protein D7X48_01925 [bacterium D16-50]|nr:hypothetical protein D7X48_01925 [bacterium D16-50]